MLWLNGASMMALMTSGDASASPMPSSPSSVRTRTSATSWQLAVLCWTDSTLRIWQMTWSIFMGISVCAVAADAESATEAYASLPRRLRGKGLPQHLDTLRHGDVRIFFPLKLQRHVTAVIHAGQDSGDACVIQVERIPLATAVIGLGLNEHSLRRYLTEFVVRILQKIPGVHQHTEPGRVDGIDNAQQAFRRASQAPMIFQREDHAAFLRFGQATVNAVDTPLESFLLSVAGDDRLEAAIRHERIEIHRVPAAGVDANARDAELIGDLEAFLRVFDVLTYGFGFRTDKVLMRPKADQIDTAREVEPFQFVTIRAAGGIERRFLLQVHLPMENVHPFNPNGSGLLYDGFNGGLRRPKVPVGVGRDAEFDKRVPPGCRAPGRRGFSAEGKGSGAARCGSEESPAGKFHS